jgi:hypothetical protein
LALKTARVALTKQFFFTLLPKTRWLCGMYSVLRFLHYNIYSREKMSSFKLSCNLFGVISVVDSITGSLLFYIPVCIRGYPFHISTRRLAKLDSLSSPSAPNQCQNSFLHIKT